MQYVNNPSGFEINLINKTEKSFIVKLLRKMWNKYNSDNVLTIGFNGFPYSFFIFPGPDEVIYKDDEYSFLQIIEFKVG